MDKEKSLFISHAWVNDKLNNKVLKVANKLRKEKGIDVKLDVWELELGHDIIGFMERMIQECDKILIISDDNYVEKSDSRSGGVGVEAQIISPDVYSKQEQNKVVVACLKKDSSGDPVLPVYMKSRLYVDLSSEDKFDEGIKEIVNWVEGNKKYEKPDIGKNNGISDNTSALTNKKPQNVGKPYLYDDDQNFFSVRFAQAFPGVRGIEWFTDEEQAIKRLLLLLKPPLEFHEKQLIWWWSWGALPIRSFKKLNKTTVLMDEDELIIDKIAAVNLMPGREFVYIQTKPSERSGMESYSGFSEELENIGFVREEFGLFDGKFITRAEYDDNAAVIDGEPINLEGKAELRCRYLSPYARIIAPHMSPINNQRFNLYDEYIRPILEGEKDLKDLVSEFRRLPKKYSY